MICRATPGLSAHCGSRIFLLTGPKLKLDVAPAIELMQWVTDHALPSGVLAEQVHPLTGEPLSVSPLTWSHATFVATVHRVLRHLGKIKVCPECGMEMTDRAPKGALAGEALCRYLQYYLRLLPGEIGSTAHRSSGPARRPALPSLVGPASVPVANVREATNLERC